MKTESLFTEYLFTEYLFSVSFTAGHVTWQACLPGDSRMDGMSPPRAVLRAATVSLGMPAGRMVGLAGDGRAAESTHSKRKEQFSCTA